MQFSVEELKTGTVNLFDHFAEIMPTQGGFVGLISLQNGIQTSFKTLGNMTQSVIDKVPEGTLLFGMYNSCSHLNLDIGRVTSERMGIATPTVLHTAQMMGAIADTIHKINPEMIWLDVRHSEGGVIGRRAIELLTADQKQIFTEQFYNVSFAPAQKIPTEYALRAYNVYSDKDRITSRWAHEQDGFTYDVKFIKCISPRRERIIWIADHGFMGSTYQKELHGQLEDIRKERGFYNGHTR